MRIALPLLICLLPSSSPAAGKIETRVQPNLTEWQGEAFGTSFHMKCSMPADTPATDVLSTQISKAIAALNAQMSLWDDDSEISRFNRQAAGEWFPVSDGTFQVIEAALAIRDQSDGAFDPTVRPLLSLWSFGPEQRPKRVPADSEIEAAKGLVGAAIESRHEHDAESLATVPTPAIRKLIDGVQLDLNAISKGYAVDVLSELAAAGQPTGYMVEIGGEVRAAGTKRDGSPWRIAIEKPMTDARAGGWAINLQDAALATSGDYRNYFEADGQRYSHTLDPRTGRPITHGLASVSVVTEDCMTADAWATALMVLGPDEGYDRAIEHNLAAFFVVHDGENFSVRATPGFPELIPLNVKMADISSWTTFLIAAVVFGVAVGGMAIGVIVSNRRLRGSCGGLNNLKDAHGQPMCESCTTPPDQCDQFRKQIAATRPD